MKKPCVIACAPTYREYHKVVNYLRSCRLINYRPFKVIIVNANPGDDTSKLIQQEKMRVDYELIELIGKPEEFWSATINRGLKKIVEIADIDDWVLISNIDIEFSEDVISCLLSQALKHDKCQMGALCTSGSTAISSGTQINSWLTTSTSHPFSGEPKLSIPKDLCIQVDLLATRCMLVPVKAVIQTGFTAERLLPHYHADLEYSHRLQKSGYIPFIYTGACVDVDMNNTGNSVYSTNNGLLARMSVLMSIRNPSNPWYRIVFVILVFPWYTWATAISAYLLRTLIETLLSKKQIEHYFGGHSRGYGGSSDLSNNDDAI